MTAIKNWFVKLIFGAIVFGLAVTAHAEEVDSYFVWEIKNPEYHVPYGYLLFDALHEKNGVTGMRDAIYRLIIHGQYYKAASYCEITDVTQKVAFGKDYFDDGLTELTAKLYLTADEYDKAERKINLLLKVAQDNLSKVRALNLKSDWFNRTGNYRDALEITEEVTNLLQGTPDENLALINQARAAKAYCGLNETQKSLELAEKILTQMQSRLGKAGMETLALMSTLAEDYRKAKRYEDCGKVLESKVQAVSERYGQNDPVITAKVILEFVDLRFEKKETTHGTELLDAVLQNADRCLDNENYRAGLQLYKALNAVTSKHLKGDNPIVLKSEYGQARAYNLIGDVPQSIELCKKNLPKFKKVFGDTSDETLMLTKILSDNYTLLGKYFDAKAMVEARLNLCKKNFGDRDARTIASTIDLANICYKTGKYKTADKLLADVEANSRNILENNPQLNYDFWHIKSLGEVPRNVPTAAQALGKSNEIREKNFRGDGHAFKYNLAIVKLFNAIEAFNKLADYEAASLNLGKNVLSEYHPAVLEMMNCTAESYLTSGQLSDAEQFTEQVFRLSRNHFGENNFYEWIALSTLAKIRRAEENFSAALEADKQALQIAERVCGKNSLERLQSLDAIASDYTAAGNVAEAIKLREKTLTDYKKILEDDDSNVLQMMTNLAENYVSAKRYNDAVTLCDETLSKQKVPVYVDNQISSYPNIFKLFHVKASAQQFLGDYANAYDNYKTLIQAYESKRDTFGLGVLSDNKNKLQWFAGIVPDYKNAANVSKEVGDMQFAFYCVEFCKGRSLIDRYNDVLVAKEYLMNDREKSTVAKYDNLLNSCRAVHEYAADKNDETLLENAEIVYFTLYVRRDGFKGELRQKYSKNKVPKDPQKRAEAEQKQTSWESVLSSFDINKNQQAIPKGACLVNFMKVSDDSLLALCLGNDTDVQAVNIPVSKDFFDKCQFYHELNAYTDINALHADGKYLWLLSDGTYNISIGRTPPEDSATAINNSAKWLALRKELSEELSRKLIQPIEQFVVASSHWIISPDAELNIVPFETLLYRDKMLIESVDVSYVPSLAVLNLMKKRERKNFYLGQSKEIFAMGDAVYGNNDAATSRGSKADFFNKLRSKSDDKIDITLLRWNNLPGTARELDKVSPLFESKDIFRREQVTENHLRSLNQSGELSKYKYLLFATHGLFVPDMPEKSSIVLSQEFNNEETDGYVTVSEWMGYDLRSNLVYLSACESGLGGYQAGEGIVGIPYALTVAGNKDTVMSLWKVDDEATAEFTASVFEKLSKGQSEVAALNATKREFVKKDNPKYRSPAVWAAFLLYGI